MAPGTVSRELARQIKKHGSVIGDLAAACTEEAPLEYSSLPFLGIILVIGVGMITIVLRTPITRREESLVRRASNVVAFAAWVILAGLFIQDKIKIYAWQTKHPEIYDALVTSVPELGCHEGTVPTPLTLLDIGAIIVGGGFFAVAISGLLVAFPLCTYFYIRGPRDATATSKWSEIFHTPGDG